MIKTRIPETDHGITGEFNTQAYDSMMRQLRDRGWMETNDLIKNGISYGLALEVGPGPGYLGLEWLKHTKNTTLKGLDISKDMIAIAERNAAEYGLSGRTEYVLGDARKMPFDNNYFDAVFTNGSLHEWAHPEAILNEAYRVLKPGGRYLISDMRRDMSPPIRWFFWLMVKPKEMRSGFITSINSAYTLEEIKELLATTKMHAYNVQKNYIGIQITGQKNK